MRGPQFWHHCGSAHHFIGADRCRWHLATFVAEGTILVSSVGDYYRDEKRITLGAGDDSWYETMVWRTDPERTQDGCPTVIDWADPIFSLRYSNVREANEGHDALCRVYDLWEP